MTPRPETEATEPGVLATSLGEAVRDRGALSELEQAVDPRTFEASVRGDATRIAGGRMMLERAPHAAFELVERVLGIAWPRAARDLLERAGAEELPLILGWDVGGGPVLGKAYLNASDCALGRRSQLAKQLGIPLAAHVIGVNVSAEGRIERKAYVQSDDAAATLEAYGDPAKALAHKSVELQIAAGAVVSYDIDASRSAPRAAFVALRDDDVELSGKLLATLPGYTPQAYRDAMPFEAGAPRSIGVSLASGAWTVYAKPSSGERTLYALEPRAVYRAPGAELGIFVEPLPITGRSYVDTRRFALSYRVFEGQPERDDVERLMRWLAEVVSREEQAGEPSLGGQPPPPWTRVD